MAAMRCDAIPTDDECNVALLCNFAEALDSVVSVIPCLFLCTELTLGKPLASTIHPLDPFTHYKFLTSRHDKHWQLMMRAICMLPQFYTY